MYTTVGGIHLTYEASTGSFTLRTEQSTDLNFTKGTYLQMIKVDGNDNAAHECEHACATCGKCTDADCTEDACADKCQGHTAAAPAEITREYLAGTWYGTETGAFDYAGNHTFVIVIDEFGKSGTVTHSALGQFRITNITILDGNSVMMDLTSDTYMISLNYENGVFTLADGKNFTYGRDEFYMSKEAPAPAHECEHVCDECEKCTDADCADAACADKCQGHTPAAPSELTEEYLVGTWYGTEIGWDGNTYTFTITFNEYGKGTATHSSLGNFNVTSIIDGGDLLHIMFDFGSYQTSLDYANGTLTLMDGMKNFTNGRDTMTMSKTAPAPAHECEHVCDECEKCTDADCADAACADKCEGHAPAAPDTLTDEYLVGTWYGTEVGGYWYSGTYTFTITFNADGSATMTHSEFGDVEIYDYYTEGNTLMIMCSAENSSVGLEYANGTFTMLEGMKGFTYGTEFTMTKTA